MDENMLKNIKMYLERETGGEYEDEEAMFAEGAQKLKVVLNKCKDSCDEDDYKNKCNEIAEFISLDEVQERKLYNYCLDFKDPYPEKNNAEKNTTNVETHKFLTKDELTRLCEFVQNHKKDKTVGMVINQLLFEHKMTAPQVYDAAMLTRQDFSRIVNSNKGISKSKIWSVIIGLHCNLEEADLILYSAGYVRKHTATDLTIEYFIKQKNYDIMAINEALFTLGLKLLSMHTEVRDRDSDPEKKKKVKEKPENIKQ